VITLLTILCFFELLYSHSFVINTMMMFSQRKVRKKPVKLTITDRGDTARH